MIKLILFDLDNTLYPTSKQVKKCRESAIKAMIKRGLPGSEKELEIKLNCIIKKLGSNNEKHLNTLVKQTKIEKNKHNAIISSGVTAYHITKQRIMKTYPDTKKTLDELKKRKITIGILTQGVTIKQWDKINRLGLYKYFNENVWVVSDEQSKKEAIKEILKKYPIKKEEIIIVGDRLDTDIKTANETGLISVQILQGPYADKKEDNIKPDHTIKKLKEITGILNKKTLNKKQ